MTPGSQKTTLWIAPSSRTTGSRSSRPSDYARIPCILDYICLSFMHALILFFPCISLGENYVNILSNSHSIYTCFYFLLFCMYFPSILPSHSNHILYQICSNLRAMSDVATLYPRGAKSAVQERSWLRRLWIRVSQSQTLG